MRGTSAILSDSGFYLNEWSCCSCFTGLFTSNWGLVSAVCSFFCGDEQTKHSFFFAFLCINIMFIRFIQVSCLLDLESNGLDAGGCIPVNRLV